MKRVRILLLLLLLGTALAACSPGHLGSNVIAFVRDGKLWTSDPNGANLFEVVAEDTPVVGYSWSPTHQVLAFRTLDPDFAKTATARQLVSDPQSGLMRDVPGGENTIGIDGGSPIPSVFSSPDTSASNAMWDNNGSRLLYRQTPANQSASSPLNAAWMVIQDDQPGSIASKSLPASYSIPSFSYASGNYLIAGNAERGVFTTTLAGTNLQRRMPDALPGHPLPATLERVLWRPAQQDQSFLYAVSTQPALTSPLNVQLMLHNLNGQTKTLASCACIQFAWSPDGNALLYSTGTQYTILNLQHNTTFQLPADSASVPYWSPDSHFLLIDGQQTLQLVNLARKQVSTLLKTEQNDQPATASTPLPGPDVQLQPVANSLWSADSRHFVFLTHDRLTWTGKQLHSGTGLYTATLDDNGHSQDMPTLVEYGNVTQPGWTYQDPNTSFLYQGS